MDKTKRAQQLVSKLYKRFNRMIASIRPVPGNSNPVKFNKEAVNGFVYDLEILLDEVRELTR